MKGVLLGPQQRRASLGAALRVLGREGPVALVTAGWQEREDQDDELIAQLGRKVVNLRLYERAEALFREDEELFQAHRARQDQLRQIQEYYRLRLERHFDAALDIDRKSAGTSFQLDEERVSMEQTHRLDQDHLERVTALREAFELQTRPFERKAVARHRAELKKVLSVTGVLAIAGGHVAVLLNRLRLFGLTELLGDHALLAFSGGAMVTGERLVLFHEHPPEGAGISEVLEQGLGWHQGVLPLPDPRLRLELKNPFRVSWMARRYAPSRCVALDHGDFVCFDGPRWFGAEGTAQLLPDGSVDAGWAS